MQFLVEFRIRTFGALEKSRYFGLVFGETFSVRMPRVTPMPKQPFAKFRISPEQASIFQLGVLLMVNSVD